jgi:probable F420-dependent oxidoreductase
MPGVPVPVTMPAEYYASVYDPIDVLCHLAARTERLELGTSAINVLYHPPVLLARRLATLDRLSGGRLVAGVTSGWMAEEFTVAGVSPEHVGAGFDEHLAAMRAVWGPDPVRHDGPRFPVPSSDIGPKPVRPTLPLLVGYNTTAGLRRAARIGDGLHPYRNDLGQLAAELELWRLAAREAGRDPATMPIVLRTAADPDADGRSGEVSAARRRTGRTTSARSRRSRSTTSCCSSRQALPRPRFSSTWRPSPPRCERQRRRGHEPSVAVSASTMRWASCSGMGWASCPRRWCCRCTPARRSSPARATALRPVLNVEERRMIPCT